MAASKSSTNRTSLIVAALLASFAFAQQPAHRLSFRGTAADATLLKHYEIRAEQLPTPSASASADNPPQRISQPAGARLHLPAGFEISVFAEDEFQRPRWMALAPNGDVFVSDSAGGKLLVLRPNPKTGALQQRFTFANDLSQPFGMAFWKNYLYVADTDEVLRFRYDSGQTAASGKPERVAALSGGGYMQHWTRDIAFSPDGSKMLVTVGSKSNDSPEGDPRRAAISEYNPDGSGHRIFASGLRNPVGIAFYPGTETLWATVNERDDMGDDLPPDYFTSVRDGGFYGWPYAFIGPHPDPEHGRERPDLVKKAIVPDVLIQAHSAALGLAFYAGNMFPPEYHGDAFIALHGSWNRAKRTGYKIIRVRFKDGKPVGGYDDFITGWSPDENSSEVWGRPVGLLVMKDGSLLICDDGARRIWRVTYKK